MLMLKKGQTITVNEGVKGEIEFVNKIFDISQVNYA